MVYTTMAGRPCAPGRTAGKHARQNSLKGEGWIMLRGISSPTDCWHCQLIGEGPRPAKAYRFGESAAVGYFCDTCAAWHRERVGTDLRPAATLVHPSREPQDPPRRRAKTWEFTVRSTPSTAWQVVEVCQISARSKRRETVVFEGMCQTQAHAVARALAEWCRLPDDPARPLQPANPVHPPLPEPASADTPESPRRTRRHLTLH